MISGIIGYILSSSPRDLFHNVDSTVQSGLKQKRYDIFKTKVKFSLDISVDMYMDY